MSRYLPRNIKVKFASSVVTLENENSRVTTHEGVEIWLQGKPANNFRAMATIPDGTLERYKHCRPEILAVDWVPV